MGLARGWVAALAALALVATAPACTVAETPRAAPATSAPREAPPPASPALGAATPTPAPAVVVLDPGHNGGNAAAPEEINRPVPAGGFSKPCNTTGTATTDGYAEHAFTFDVATRAADLLRAGGMTVVLTRTDDAGVGPCVDARAGTANEAGAALAVSIHADGAAADVRGFHVVTPGLAPDGGNAAILDSSAEAAATLVTSFAAATAQPPATYPGALVQPGLTRRTDLAGLNLARVPAVLIECANMRNPVDAMALRDPGWRQRAAQGIADGVLAYLASR